MKKKLNIAVVTSNRADYGLLYWLLHELHVDKDIRLQLLVTGDHLSKAAGLTVKEISKDKLPIAARIPTHLSSDTAAATAQSLGQGILGFTKAFSKLKPDMLVVLGDRYEILAACAAAIPFRIPITHIHGGEVTEGVLDEQVRHAITKIAHLHFVSTETYRQNVIQMGEKPENVFHLGAPGLESIRRTKLLSQKDLEKSLKFLLEPKTILVTLHPETLRASNHQVIDELLKTLSKSKLRVIFTASNRDPGGVKITEKIQKFVRLHAKKKTYLFVPSLGSLKYLSLLPLVDAVVGNSSSGIIEVPSFGKPTVNIGDRQKGRIHPASVINCKTTASDIRRGLQKALTPSFQSKCEQQKLDNPYHNGLFSKKAVSLIKQKAASPTILHKTFRKMDKIKVK